MQLLKYINLYRFKTRVSDNQCGLVALKLFSSKSVILTIQKLTIN